MKYTYYAYIYIYAWFFRYSFVFLSSIACVISFYDKSCKCILTCNKPHNLAEYLKKIFLYSIFFMFFSGIDVCTTTKMWLVYAKMGRVVGMSKVHTGRSIFQSKEL